MPDNEVQEAVCGTCGGDPRDGDGYHAYNCPERTGRIPAPVVPSDERVEAVDAEDLIAQLHAAVASPTPSQDAEGDGRVPSWTIGSWPRPRGTVMLHFRHHDDFNGVELPAQEARELAFMLLDRAMSADGDANWWANDARREAIESAIRARYEERLDALAPWAFARSLGGGFICRDCGHAAEEWRGIEHASYYHCNLGAALESLGGRS